MDGVVLNGHDPSPPGRQVTILPFRVVAGKGSTEYPEYPESRED